jgi:hypothetical protein
VHAAIEARLAKASDMPVGVAQMLDDRGVVALLLARPFQPFDALSNWLSR